MKYVALLRGISPLNPNMRNEKLRGVFEKLGFQNVQTVISSGNVIFVTRILDVATLETKIEKAIFDELGFTSTTIIRTQQSIEQLVKKNPFGDREDVPMSRFNVTFLKNNPTCDIEFPHHVKDKKYVLVSMHQNAICSVVDLSGTKTPDLMVWLEKKYGKEITTRTWKTVMRILKKFG